MGKSVHNEETRKLMEGILKLQSVDECYAFFEDLCTVNELLSLGQRFEVANMLRNHKTYNEVAEVTGASTATISRVNRCLNYGTDGYQLVLSRMEKLEKNLGEAVNLMEISLEDTIKTIQNSKKELQ